MSAHRVQPSTSPAVPDRLLGRAVRRTEDRRLVTGRGGIVATAAAAANAVAAALAPFGVVVRELPLSAPNLARWIRDAGRG